MGLPPVKKPTWGRILEEIQSKPTIVPGRPPTPDFDGIRRAKLQRVFGITKRPLIIYATACTIPGKAVPFQALQLDFSDKLAFTEVTELLETGSDIDVMLHSPGGLAEAAEAIVDILRARFKHVRFIIPVLAKSAATMLALSGDEILLGPDGELGPTDPQFITSQGASPAQAIIDQFEMARKKIAENQGDVVVWAPILAQMGPALLAQCQTAIVLSRELVSRWLETYMFKGEPDAHTHAEEVAHFLADHSNFKSHARGVRLATLQNLRLKVDAFDTSTPLGQALWELYCAVDITLSNTATVRLVENHLGHAVLRSHGPPISLGIELQQAPPPPQAPAPAPRLPSPPSRPPLPKRRRGKR